jgi:hypothetical protein
MSMDLVYHIRFWQGKAPALAGVLFVCLPVESPEEVPYKPDSYV